MPLLLQGDCLSVMQEMPDKSIDCFVCDLPYGQLALAPAVVQNPDGGDKQAYAGCPWDVKIDLVAFWTHVKRLAKNDHVPVLMFCNTKFGIDLINSNPSWFRYDLVWDKGFGISFLLANKMPMKSHEMIYVFSKKGTYYRRIDISGNYGPSAGGEKPNNVYGLAGRDMKEWKLNRAPGSGKNVYGIIQSSTYHSAGGHDISGNKHQITRMASGGDGRRCVLSVVQVPKARGAGLHPTEKPVHLYKWLLERYCPPGGRVLDPTAGSFNAIIAAEELGLDGIGIEMDPVFYKKGQAKFGLDVSDNLISHL